MPVRAVQGIHRFHTGPVVTSVRVTRRRFAHLRRWRDVPRLGSALCATTQPRFGQASATTFRTIWNLERAWEGAEMSQSSVAYSRRIASRRNWLSVAVGCLCMMAQSPAPRGRSRAESSCSMARSIRGGHRRRRQRSECRRAGTPLLCGSPRVATELEAAGVTLTAAQTVQTCLGSGPRSSTARSSLARRSTPGMRS